MAKQQQINLRKRELVQQLADSRQAISQSRRSLQQRLQIKNILQELIAKKPKTLFAGSAVAGLAATLFLRRPRKAPKARQPLSLALLGALFTLIKPALQAWIVARAKQATHPAQQTRPQQAGAPPIHS